MVNFLNQVVVSPVWCLARQMLERGSVVLPDDKLVVKPR